MNHDATTFTDLASSKIPVQQPLPVGWSSDGGRAAARAAGRAAGQECRRERRQELLLLLISSVEVGGAAQSCAEAVVEGSLLRGADSHTLLGFVEWRRGSAAGAGRGAGERPRRVARERGSRGESGRGESQRGESGGAERGRAITKLWGVQVGRWRGEVLIVVMVVVVEVGWRLLQIRSARD